MSRRCAGILALLVGAFACTVDDATEGKRCDLDKPLDQQCIAGYACKCESTNPETCFCVAEGTQLGLTSNAGPAAFELAPSFALAAPSAAELRAARARLADPSSRFLNLHHDLRLP